MAASYETIRIGIMAHMRTRLTLSCSRCGSDKNYVPGAAIILERILQSVPFHFKMQTQGQKAGCLTLSFE